MNCEMCWRKSFSRTPSRYANTFDAAKSLSMPFLPNSATPCDHDWKIDIIGTLREPKYEYRSGSSRHRHAFAASSRIATSGVRMQLPALTSARSVDASRVGAVGGGTGDMA
ncbi:hypothetical protein CMsap09_13045 [Clavibacter michiganensis]|uniref:Uncharacterized protein n=1 Tax=Clavibacter michiganensis TaxID=28447 RepID=A0A251XWH5_9MICO|nr:hypothetical protein CMsap09_13045 [Clavibacter michiganensis]